MRSARLDMALDSGALALPSEGRIAVYRPRMGDDLSALPLDRVTVLTGFRPDRDHFAAQCSVAPAPPYAAALVCLPRSREAARALIARAAAEVAPGGWIAVDGQKTDGIDTALKDLRGRVDLSEALSKAHGKLASFAAGVDLSDWRATLHRVQGFQTLPGIFSADGPDRGSVLLAAALPARLSGKVADLGAGWGFLAAEILKRPGVRRLDLVEAEADALDCARVNITDPRARFHWADATTWRPETLLDLVVMNPPFHSGRAADPALGAAFIRAAGRMLAQNGELWLVANRHLPYDAVLSDCFLTVEDLPGDSGFRVIHATRPRRAKA
ncbi:class I SAM-dependent methyltransferase [Rhodobacter calidifons]|uniref:Class I SAM-dependent methyltransferase n=1 Tax=Rhodobacter calidifons TaxID=2715277 RepID=A0ABX0G4Q5_9RHOB|nr:methyltransferase [Rhodobacter calidifons]NHB76211.1 class I SAM-dependent methyltransferase [Rhodobacter calidifons]